MKKRLNYKNSDPAGSHDEWRESIVENAPALICRHLKDTTLTYVNETMCRYFNLTKKQLVGKKLIDWVPDPDKTKIQELIGSLSVLNDPCSLEFAILRGAGDLRFIDWNFTVISIADSGTEIQSLGIDITERKLAEIKLSESEQSYHQLFNTISEAILVMNGDAVVKEANFGVQMMYGYDRDELIGRTPEFLSAPGRNDLLKVYDLFKNTFETGTLNSFEFWGMKKSGEIFPNAVTIHKGIYSGKDVIISITRDATEQKKFESILRESEERYKSIFQNSSAVMLVIDPENLDIVDANKSACEYYGYPKEKLTSMRISSINILPDEKLNEELSNAVSKEKFLFRFQHRLANGDIRDVEVNSGPVEFHGKQYLYSIIHDVTEKKKTEEELRRERELFISGPVITVKWNAGPKLNIEYISPNVSEILGYQSEDFVTGGLDLKSLVHPEDADRCKNEAQEYQRTNAPTFQQEYRLRNKRGEYNWYADFVRVIKDASDNVEYYHGYIYDISKRKRVEEALRQSEERFRLVSSSIANISYSFKTDNSDNFYLDWIFGASEIITGFSSDELVKSKSWGHLVTEEDFPLFKKHILEVRPGKSDSCQLRINQKNGSVIWVEATAECKVDESNPETLFLYGAIVNINERKLAEEALINSEKELRKTNKMKDKFFSIISHDLRSPFQGLIGMANILVEDEDLTAEERKEFTIKLYESLKTQFHFIDDLLTWNRVQRGAIEFIPAPDDLASVIHETLELLLNSIENKQLNVVYDKPESILLNFDRNMVATIVRNLLTNAIKFTPHGGTIKISIDDQPDTITVSVQDSGVGIEKSELSKLWESEFHKSTKGTEGEDGTGLGLILCKEFVDKHQGTISAESEINKGSTFKFRIPKNLPLP